MSETVKIGNSWYVVEDICGIVGPQPNDAEVKLLMRGGHILKMTDLGEDVIEYIRQRRDPQPDSPPTPPVAEFAALAPGQVGFPVEDAKVTDVDMAPAEDIPT